VTTVRLPVYPALAYAHTCTRCGCRSKEPLLCGRCRPRPSTQHVIRPCEGCGKPVKNYAKKCWTCAGYGKTRKKRLRLTVIRLGTELGERCPEAFKPVIEARMRHYEARAAMDLPLFQDIPQP
jgi:hypothetical protein